MTSGNDSMNGNLICIDGQLRRNYFGGDKK